MSCCRLCGVVVALASASIVQAQNTWTGNASGNWSNTSNWSSGVPASGINTQLIFGATSNASMTNDIAGPFFLLNKMTFSAGDPTYSLVGTALDFRTNGSAVTPSIVMETTNGVTLSNGAALTNNLTVSGAGTGNLTFNSNLTGVGSLTYSGAGTLSLGASNTYSGGTFVNSGSLALVGFSGVLPPGQNVTIGNGSGPATLNANNVSNNSTSLAIGTLALNGGTFHAPGGLGGDFYLNKLNMTGGTVDLSASPNYILHFVNAGAAITMSNVFPAVSTWVGGGTSRVQNDTGGPLTINASTGLLVAGIILSSSGTNRNFVIDKGNVRLTNTGNTADITVTNQGSLYSNDLSTDVGSGKFGTLGTGTITLNTSSLTYDGPPATSAKPIVMAGGAGDFALGSDLTLTGVMSQANAGAGLTLNGPLDHAVTLTLTANNTYTGQTYVLNHGIIAVPTIGNAGIASPIGASSLATGNLYLGRTLNGRGDLLLTGAGSYSTDRSVNVDGLYTESIPSGGGIGVANSGTTLFWNGKITDGFNAGSLSKTGPGTLVLTNGTNNYTGGTYIEAGTLRTGAIPSVGPLVLLGGTFDMSSFSQSVGSLAGVAGTTVLTNGNTLTAGSDNTSTTFGGNILGGALVKTGNGVLTLSGLGNTANLTTVGVGAIAVADMAALGTGIVTLQGAGDNGGGLLYTGPTAPSAKNITLAASSTIQVTTPGANLTLNGVISESSAGQALIVTGPFNSGTPSTLTLGATNTYTGRTEILGNAVVPVSTVTNTGVPGPIGAFPTTDPTGLVLQNGTLLLTGTSGPYSTNRGVTLQGAGYASNIGVNDPGTTLTISGAVAGPGIFHKVGAGTLTLTNATNNFSGGLFVDVGTLRIDGPTGAGVIPVGSNVTVRAGATLNQAAPVSSFPTPNNPIGAITLDGGTLRMSGNADRYYLNQIAVTNNGGLIDLTPTGQSLRLIFVNSGAAITVNGNTTCLGGSSYLRNETGGEMPITIAPGVTFTCTPSLFGASGLYSTTPIRVTGGGTLYLTNAPPPFEGAYVRVNQARLRMDDLTNVSAGVFNLTLDNGTLQIGGPTVSTPATFAVTSGGGALEVLNAATTLTLTGALPGTPFTPLTKSGPGTLVFTNTANTFGSLTVAAGRLDVPVDAAIGLGPITVGPLGTVRYTATASTARTFVMNAGTLEAPAGVTLTLNGATVGGGFLRGTGAFALTSGTIIAGSTSAASTTINVTGSASMTNVTNGAALLLAAGPVTPTSLDLFTNQGSGSVTLSQTSRANVSDFQTYGTVTISPAAITQNFSKTTLITNVGATPLYFNGGSRTFVGTPDTAVFPSNWPDPSLRGLPTFVAGIDLNGKNAIVAGGLFVNNGYVEDTTNGGAGTATVVADFGALVKGAGFFQNSVQTINGGKFQAGNSPGAATFGRFVFGPGGVARYVFAIDDATGVAGPTPDALGHVSGWGLVRVDAPPVTHGGLNKNGDFTWTATAADKLVISIETLLNPTTVGLDAPGPMDHFDATRPYLWPAVEWSGTYAGPTDAATLDAATAFETGNFANSFAGTFGWSLDASSRTLSLTYTPRAVPEPGTLVLVGAVGAPLLLRRRGRRR
jgi:autotransporter-associated beta strand protein